MSLRTQAILLSAAASLLFCASAIAKYENPVCGGYNCAAEAQQTNDGWLKPSANQNDGSASAQDPSFDGGDNQGRTGQAQSGQGTPRFYSDVDNVNNHLSINGDPSNGGSSAADTSFPGGDNSSRNQNPTANLFGSPSIAFSYSSNETGGGGSLDPSGSGGMAYPVPPAQEPEILPKSYSVKDKSPWASAAVFKGAMNGLQMTPGNPLSSRMVTGASDAARMMLGQILQQKWNQTPGQSTGKAKNEQNATKNQAADNLALIERYHAAAAIEFVRDYLYNFTTDGGNKWNTVRNMLFVPAAILILLPGAVLSQVRATVAQGFFIHNPIFGELPPFEGLMRSMIAIFLIPATYLVVNYGIDVANSLIYSVQSVYTNVFGSDMYQDAFCGHIRAFPVREPDENYGMIKNQHANMYNYFGNTPLAILEGKTLAIKYEDPCAGIYIVPEDRANEIVPYMVNEERLAFNQVNAGMAIAWTILCAAQQVYLYYLFFVGPIMAALWVYPNAQLRAAFTSWCDGVITVCFWSLFWATTILLMAICRGVDDTGTIMFTALNVLACSSVKMAFDFSGLVREMASQATSIGQKVAQAAAAGKQGAGGGGGGGGGGQQSSHNGGRNGNGHTNGGAAPSGPNTGAPGAGDDGDGSRVSDPHRVTPGDFGSRFAYVPGHGTGAGNPSGGTGHLSGSFGHLMPPPPGVSLQHVNGGEVKWGAGRDGAPVPILTRGDLLAMKHHDPAAAALQAAASHGFLAPSHGTLNQMSLGQLESMSEPDINNTFDIDYNDGGSSASPPPMLAAGVGAAAPGAPAAGTGTADPKQQQAAYALHQDQKHLLEAMRAAGASEAQQNYVSRMLQAQEAAMNQGLQQHKPQAEMSQMLQAQQQALNNYLQAQGLASNPAVDGAKNNVFNDMSLSVTQSYSKESPPPTTDGGSDPRSPLAQQFAAVIGQPPAVTGSNGLPSWVPPAQTYGSTTGGQLPAEQRKEAPTSGFNFAGETGAAVRGLYQGFDNGVCKVGESQGTQVAFSAPERGFTPPPAAGVTPPAPPQAPTEPLAKSTPPSSEAAKKATEGLVNEQAALFSPPEVKGLRGSQTETARPGQSGAEAAACPAPAAAHPGAPIAPVGPQKESVPPNSSFIGDVGKAVTGKYKNDFEQGVCKVGEQEGTNAAASAPERGNALHPGTASVQQSATPIPAHGGTALSTACPLPQDKGNEWRKALTEGLVEQQANLFSPPPLIGPHGSTQDKGPSGNSGADGDDGRTSMPVSSTGSTSAPYCPAPSQSADHNKAAADPAVKPDFIADLGRSVQDKYKGAQGFDQGVCKIGEQESTRVVGNDPARGGMLAGSVLSTAPHAAPATGHGATGTNNTAGVEQGNGNAQAAEWRKALTAGLVEQQASVFSPPPVVGPHGRNAASPTPSGTVIARNGNDGDDGNDARPGAAQAGAMSFAYQPTPSASPTLSGSGTPSAMASNTMHNGANAGMPASTASGFISDLGKKVHEAYVGKDGFDQRVCRVGERQGASVIASDPARGMSQACGRSQDTVAQQQPAVKSGESTAKPAHQAEPGNLPANGGMPSGNRPSELSKQFLMQDEVARQAALFAPPPVVGAANASQQISNQQAPAQADRASAAPATEQIAGYNDKQGNVQSSNDGSPGQSLTSGLARQIQSNYQQFDNEVCKAGEAQACEQVKTAAEAPASLAKQSSGSAQSPAQATYAQVESQGQSAQQYVPFSEQSNRINAAQAHAHLSSELKDMADTIASTPAVQQANRQGAAAQPSNGQAVHPDQPQSVLNRVLAGALTVRKADSSTSADNHPVQKQEASQTPNQATNNTKPAAKADTKFGTRPNDRSAAKVNPGAQQQSTASLLGKALMGKLKADEEAFLKGSEDAARASVPKPATNPQDQLAGKDGGVGTAEPKQ